MRFDILIPFIHHPVSGFSGKNYYTINKKNIYRFFVACLSYPDLPQCNYVFYVLQENDFRIPCRIIYLAAIAYILSLKQAHINEEMTSQFLQKAIDMNHYTWKCRRNTIPTNVPKLQPTSELFDNRTKHIYVPPHMRRTLIYHTEKAIKFILHQSISVYTHTHSCNVVFIL